MFTESYRLLRPKLLARVQSDDNARVVRVALPVAGSEGEKPGKLTNEDLSILEEMPDLEYLTAGGDALTDGALERIGRMERLQVLEIHGSFTDRGIQHLARLKDLRLLNLNLHSTNVSDSAITQLQAELPNCELRIQRRRTR